MPSILFCDLFYMRMMYILYLGFKKVFLSLIWSSWHFDFLNYTVDFCQKNLWNAFITISDLRDTVTKKRHGLQLLKRKLKLAFILKGQVSYVSYLRICLCKMLLNIIFFGIPITIMGLSRFEKYLFFRIFCVTCSVFYVWSCVPVCMHK